MKFKCKQCMETFEKEEEADLHEKVSHHHVELSLPTTYWGEHFILE